MHYIPLKNSRVGDVMNVPMDDFKTHDEYVKEFSERKKRIVERTGKTSFDYTGDTEYLKLINEDIEIQNSKKVKESINEVDSNLERPTTENDSVVEAVIDEDPFTSEAPAGKSSSQDNLNVCISCEG